MKPNEQQHRAEYFVSLSLAPPLQLGSLAGGSVDDMISFVKKSGL